MHWQSQDNNYTFYVILVRVFLYYYPILCIVKQNTGSPIVVYYTVNNARVLMYHWSLALLLLLFLFYFFLASKGCFVTWYERIKVCTKGLRWGYLGNRNIRCIPVPGIDEAENNTIILFPVNEYLPGRTSRNKNYILFSPSLLLNVHRCVAAEWKQCN